MVVARQLREYIRVERPGHDGAILRPAAMGSTGPVGASWDAEYRRGRYAGEPPIAWVGTILSMLQAEPALWGGRGLYVGCGNGRNYLPLVDAGATLDGIDLSHGGDHPAGPAPPGRGRSAVGAAISVGQRPTGAFAYLVAIQVFQHGDGATLSAAFAQAGRAPAAGRAALRARQLGRHADLPPPYGGGARPSAAGSPFATTTGPRRGC